MNVEKIMNFMKFQFHRKCTTESVRKNRFILFFPELSRSDCRLQTCWLSNQQLSGSDLQTEMGSFPFVPPSTLCSPQLQSTCHYIVNHYVKILHVYLGVANNRHPLSWGGGGTNGKDPGNVFLVCSIRTLI